MPLSEGEQDEDSTLIKRRRFLKNRYKKGDRVDVKELLFNESRDFLVKYNSQLVKAEHLEGKVIVLHFERVKPSSSCYTLITSNTWRHTGHLVEIYPKLLSSGCPFEVVFVSVSDVSDGTEDASQKRFEEMFSFMPWTAVPFFDSEEILANCFVASEHGSYHLPSSFVISNTGVVLQHDARPIFRVLGADAYPFSDERIERLILEDDLFREPRLSLKALLASPERDYVINNKGHKVNICDLEDKMVALYLYEEGCTNDLTTSLRNAYEFLMHKEKKKFEVVLIYIHDSLNTLGRTDAESFKKGFETMPWLALPFKDTNCKKVQRVFLYPFGLEGPHPNHSLVIIGPSGKLIEPFGAGTVLKYFGIKAYPFTREKAHLLHVQKVKNVKLDMLWRPEAVFMRGYMPESTYLEVLFSNINVGQRIIVFRDTENVWHREFRIKLEKMYLERKGSNDEFEVLHIGLRGGTVPWFRVHPDFSSRDSDTIKVLCDIFCNAYGVLFFDLDGKVVRAAMIPPVSDTNYPFYVGAGSLENEVLTDLIDRFDWDLDTFGTAIRG
ncbi:hypothetical protein OROGR_027677 [Orobanche gracilis]